LKVIKENNVLEIRDLYASVDGNEILKGINLKVNKGEVHAIMGPNGSGKSTLAKVLAGHPQYEVTRGEVIFEGKDLLAMAPDERAREGIFMAFQYPVEVPGVSNAQFLRLAYNEKQKHLGAEELDPLEFKDLLKEKAQLVEMDASFMTRSVNEGFSGGEKKRNEILQMAVLDPKMAVLDETDSGLDIDALRIVAEGVNKLHDPEKAVVLVTHYQRLLNYITPDFVHVLFGGRIVKEGGKELALELEEKGYDWLKNGNGKSAAAPRAS
jgi:Fe-S cluster assembly ATP-binding protein